MVFGYVKKKKIEKELNRRIEDLDYKSKTARNVNIESNMNFQMEALMDFRAWLLKEDEYGENE